MPLNAQTSQSMQTENKQQDSIKHKNDIPNFEGFIKEAQGVFGERIYTDYLRRFAHGIDASCYRYVPRAVVRAKDESDIIALFALSEKYHTPLTFRAAGTSLSGQACSDSILVLANAHWQDITLHFDSKNTESKNANAEAVSNKSAEDTAQTRDSKICDEKGGLSSEQTRSYLSGNDEVCERRIAPLSRKAESPTSISCSCGVIGQEANDALKPYHKKIGPDPATINNAMIGGIFSNNSSGMCCGVKQNSYNTIKSVRLILGDGSIVDTSARAKPEENLESFLTKHANMANALLNLRSEILADKWLQKLIARKFAIKNTTGYSINALLDFDNVCEILNHIFIGAEGTLGFVSKVEYECVEDYAFKACALLFYENLIAGAKAVQILAANESLVSAAEIMDYACLVSAKDIEGAPRELQSLQNGACAILVQLESNAQDELDSKIRTITSALKPAPSLFGVHFSQDSKEMASWWKIRKALLPLAAANRPSGSIVITEDICFPIESFAQGIAGIEGLFARFKFEGIIFGHALSGNVHFIITPNLNDKAQSARFTDFMEALVDCVVDLGGSSKAEHGTGRMIAPFVEREWGAKAYAINRRIKEIFDPRNLINPDVIISDNPHIHTQNLKESAEVEDFINQCMECGFCEKVCPSRELTLTPRQRIAVRREIARLEGLLGGGAESVSVKSLDSSNFTESATAKPENTENIVQTRNSKICDEKGGLSSEQTRSYLSGNDEVCERRIAPLSRKAELLKELESLKTGYTYFGVATCATCSMCALSCPLEIDTAKIANTLSPTMQGKMAQYIAQKSAAHFSTALNGTKVGLTLANAGLKILGNARVNAVGKKLGLPFVPASLPQSNNYKLESKTFAKTAQSVDSKKQKSIENQNGDSKISKDSKSPDTSGNQSRDSKHPDTTPRGGIFEIKSGLSSEPTRSLLEVSAAVGECRIADFSQRDNAQPKSVIYFSACLNRAFAPHKNAPDSRPLQAVFESVCQKAGINVIYPKHLQNLCCGKAYRDFPQDSQAKANEALNALRASLQETLSELEDTPQNIAIVCDHSACSYELLRRLKEDLHKDSTHSCHFEHSEKSKDTLPKSLPLFDMPQFIESVLLKRLTITPLDEDIALYAMCATRKGGWEKSLESVARACVSGKVLIHHKTQCCGFAGNKGFSHPELNKSALRELSEFYHAEQEKQESCKNAVRHAEKERGSICEEKSGLLRSAGLTASAPSEQMRGYLGGNDEARARRIPDFNHKDNAQNLKLGFSSSSTCEIGLNEHTNIKWQNLLYLVDRVSTKLTR